MNVPTIVTAVTLLVSSCSHQHNNLQDLPFWDKGADKSVVATCNITPACEAWVEQHTAPGTIFHTYGTTTKGECRHLPGQPGYDPGDPTSWPVCSLNAGVTIYGQNPDG